MNKLKREKERTLRRCPGQEKNLQQGTKQRKVSKILCPTFPCPRSKGLWPPSLPAGWFAAAAWDQPPLPKAVGVLVQWDMAGSGLQVNLQQGMSPVA